MMPTTELRWVGPDPIDILERAAKLDRTVLYAAQYLADAIVDGKSDTEILWRRDCYESARAEARRVNDLSDRLYGSAASGRFAGYLVRES